MQRIGGEGTGERTSMRTVATASLVGATMEWYDFMLYGVASALVLGPLFFPDFSALAGTLAAFGTYGIGFAARPIGGLIFGHYGDKVGRKSMLVLTLLIMGVATFLVGLLPTFEQIGVWAPILLVLLRVFQGIGLGGEYGGAALMTIEHAPRDERGFWGSLPQLGSPGGLLIATGVLSLFATLPEEQFLAWGWRVPFLLSAVLLVVGLFIRLRIMETPAFQEMQESGTEARMPILDLLRSYPRNIALTLGARLAETAAFGVFNTFAISYAGSQLGLPEDRILNGVLIASAGQLLMFPVFGWLSDRVGRRPMYMTGAAVVGLMAFPFFLLLNTEVTALVWLGLSFGFIFGNGLMFSVQATFFSELFGVRVRYSGVSLAYQLGGVLGGFVPFIATALLAAGGGEPWLVSTFLAALALLALACTYLLTETFRSDVSETEVQASSRQPVGAGER